MQNALGGRACRLFNDERHGGGMLAGVLLATIFLESLQL